MAVITDLPVFSFRPNWKEPIVERVSFMTDVIRASKGAEQRRSLRETPRRSFEADFLLRGPERTFWDLFMNKLGGGEMYAPVPWEVHALTAKLNPGVTRIDFSTEYREWEFFDNHYALLIGKSALDTEIVYIDLVDDDGVRLSEGIARPWPVGTRLIPLRRAVLTQVGDMTHLSSGTATATVEVQFNAPNPWTPAADPSPVYSGLPVFLGEPNWVDDLTVEMPREIAMLDTGFGRTYQVDKLGRSLVGQSHRWFLPGRQKLSAFRDMIYRHRGRAGGFWLPTFKADFRLVNAPTAAAKQITVENVGFSYTGGPTSGREYIAIKHSEGTILRKVTGAVLLTANTERLSLDLPLGLDLSPGLVHRISFADTARFDSDEFEISHFGGVDAHHDSSTMFRAFKNTRTTPEPNSLPIPVGVRNNTPCGDFVDPYRSIWKYFVTSKFDITNRSATLYNDAAWKTSNGPFGNKPGTGAVTPIPPDSTAWFRATISAGVTSFNLTCDDVATVYLNGQSVGTYQLGTSLVELPRPATGGLLAVRVIDTKGTYIAFVDDIPHE